MQENKSTILIVEDIEINIIILEELLESEYNISSVKNGNDALKKVKEQEFDLVLLDIGLPDIDGYEVCKRLKRDELTKDIPILFLTASNDEESIEKAFDMGGIDYITKPFLIKELKARIKTHIALNGSMRKLEFLANIDPMTGIYNRRKFFYLAEEKFEHQKENLFAVMIDIDKFKAINDEFGHQIGDRVIKSVTGIIKEDLPQNAIFGRLGGEEFAIVLNMPNQDELFELIEKVRDEIYNKDIQIDDSKVKVTISAGISSYKDKYQNIDQFLSDADCALYDAKGQGRNKTMVRDRRD
jgi:two-component system glycerol uptake and utilization response regulator